MKEYDVNHLKLLVNGEYTNLDCFVEILKDKAVDMEQYIASYKHLIGCEFYLKDRKQKGRFIINVFTDNDGCISHVHCNAGYEYRFIHHTDLMVYLDDKSLGTYKEYMQLHYPEYKHVWSKQL